MELTLSQRELVVKTLERLRDLTAPSLPIDATRPTEELVATLLGRLWIRRTTAGDRQQRMQLGLMASRLVDLAYFLQGRPYALYEKRSDGFVRQLTLEEMCRWVTYYFEGENRSSLDLTIDGQAYWVHPNFTRYGWSE